MLQSNGDNVSGGVREAAATLPEVLSRLLTVCYQTLASSKLSSISSVSPWHTRSLNVNFTCFLLTLAIAHLAEKVCEDTRIRSVTSIHAFLSTMSIYKWCFVMFCSFGGRAFRPNTRTWAPIVWKRNQVLQSTSKKLRNHNATYYHRCWVAISDCFCLLLWFVTLKLWIIAFNTECARFFWSATDGYSKVDDLLSYRSRCIILDVRSADDFENCHFQSSVPWLFCTQEGEHAAAYTIASMDLLLFDFVAECPFRRKSFWTRSKESWDDEQVRQL